MMPWIDKSLEAVIWYRNSGLHWNHCCYSFLVDFRNIVVWRKYCTYLINQQNDIIVLQIIENWCNESTCTGMPVVTWWTCCCCHLLLNFYFEIHAHVCVYMHPRMNAALETLKRLETLVFNWENVRVVFQIWQTLLLPNFTNWI